MDPEQSNLDAWTAYGMHHLQRATETPEVDRFAWGFQPAGPGAEVLGDITGRRVVDLGSGQGRYAAYLAREHGALVDAVEFSPTQHERACARYERQPGLNLVLADVVDYLRQAEPCDVAYSVHALTYVDPHRLLPALATALKPDGRLVFSVLHTNAVGEGPSATVTARPEILHLAGGGELTVRMWIPAPELWQGMPAEHGFVVDSIDVLDAPEEDNPLSCRLFRAHRTGVGER
ncbi:class I SAM-dependent methyltransferase (plasmid) [Embleya sp. NBC_00888]|uniref:class I SAM-dependent methyltransferase n=1 Tax=Embleya sp. NBC_00888 TaxID=2975960 RepID=UPI002F912506|nr:class I SAM-dependent methyltransferase [Embleya sp. NBC_00888]